MSHLVARGCGQLRWERCAFDAVNCCAGVKLEDRRIGRNALACCMQVVAVCPRSGFWSKLGSLSQVAACVVGQQSWVGGQTHRHRVRGVSHVPVLQLTRAGALQWISWIGGFCGMTDGQREECVPKRNWAGVAWGWIVVAIQVFAGLGKSELENFVHG